MSHVDIYCVFIKRRLYHAEECIGKELSSLQPYMNVTTNYQQLFFKMNAIVKIVNIRIVNRMVIETLIQCLYFETYMGISCLYVFANRSSQS